MSKKIYIIRKYVVAKSIQEAIKTEKKKAPDDVWLEETSQRKMLEDLIDKKNV